MEKAKRAIYYKEGLEKEVKEFLGFLAQFPPME